MKARAGTKMFYVNCKMKIIKKKDTASIHWSENNFKTSKGKLLLGDSEIKITFKFFKSYFSFTYQEKNHWC